MLLITLDTTFRIRESHNFPAVLYCTYLLVQHRKACIKIVQLNSITGEELQHNWLWGKFSLLSCKNLLQY